MSLSRLLQAFKKAPLVGAFFVWAQLAPAWAGECVPMRVDARAMVARVTDGDTLELSDGRHLRLIGLDTPEMNYRSGRPQPLAVAAREALRGLVRGAKRVEIQYGRERRDGYGRLLGHAFLPDGESLEAKLLEQGLGTLLVIPPNLANVACYQAAERRARKAGRGLWALPGYRPVAASALEGRSPGYGQVHGRVTRVDENRGGVWLTLDRRLTAHVPRESLPLFEGCRWQSLTGRTLQVRGRLRHPKGRWRVTLRHPAQMEWSGRPVQGCGLDEAPEP